MRTRFFLTLTCLLFVAQGHAKEFYAAQITAENRHLLPAGGLDATGGLQDWLLTDGELCAVISDVTHPTYLSMHGGALVDLWHCDLANDQWSSMHTQLNLQQEQIPPFEEITAGYTDDEAWVMVSARDAGLHTRVRYQLQTAQPGTLTVQTRIERYSEGADLGMFGSLVLHPGASLIPFSIDTDEPQRSAGFDLPAIDTSDVLSILSSLDHAKLQVLLGSRHRQATISYGLEAPRARLRGVDGSEDALAGFKIGGREFTMFGAFTRPFPGFWTSKPGAFSFALGQLFDLGVGETFLFDQPIGVSARAEASPFSDALYNGHTVTGQLDTNEAGIVVSDLAGNPLTFARPDSNGSFAFRLPGDVDEFDLAITTNWGTHRISASAQSDHAMGRLDTGAPALLRLPTGSAMSLLFIREQDQHVFHSEMLPLTLAGERLPTGPESLSLSLAGIDTDPRVVELPPGSYRILASRGPEFGVTQASLNLKAGVETKLQIATPQRAVETPGLIGVDFHVHSGVSFDSSLQPQQRVRDFVAHGGEVLVPTEHNISYDLRGIIEEMGLSQRLHSFPGVEITGMVRSAATPTTIGHSNVFPVEVRPQAFMGGAPPAEGQRLGRVIELYKAQYPQSIFQLNHPRGLDGGDDLTFFDHLSVGSAFDPTQPLAAANNQSLLQVLPGSTYRDIDFDALELLNGASMKLYELVRRDWFALLRQNHYKVATANSDSHISHELVAYPRSYVVVTNDDPSQVETTSIVDALGRGALYGSTGPILEVQLDDKGPGETLLRPRGVLRVAVRSAPWVNADELRIWLNGEPWRTAPLPESGDYETEIVVEKDSFLFIEVAGAASDIYSSLLPGYQPFAFANPIFIDVDGDGWTFTE
ncbi:MAG: hypothetical protein Hals2KO_27100 [Halioglobus sp.]